MKKELRESQQSHSTLQGELEAVLVGNRALIDDAKRKEDAAAAATAAAVTPTVDTTAEDQHAAELQEKLDTAKSEIQYLQDKLEIDKQKSRPNR